jgi:hypothetical protein
MFPKVISSFLAGAFFCFTAQASASDKCSESDFVYVYKNDERIGFIDSDEKIEVVYEVSGRLKGEYQVNYPSYAGWMLDSVTIEYIVGKDTDSFRIFSLLEISESGGSKYSWFSLREYSGQDISFVISAGYTNEESCSFILEENWKHNQSNKAPASQAGTH